MQRQFEKYYVASFTLINKKRLIYPNKNYFLPNSNIVRHFVIIDLERKNDKSSVKNSMLHIFMIINHHYTLHLCQFQNSMTNSDTVYVNLVFIQIESTKDILLCSIE